MRLQITVGALKGLNEEFSAYVKIKDGGKKYKTRVVENSVAPQWNETFVLELEGKKPLLLEVYDHNTWTSNTCLGRTHLVYKDLVRGKPEDLWHPLKADSGDDSDVSLRVTMLAIDFGQAAAAPSTSVPEPASPQSPAPAVTQSSWFDEPKSAAPPPPVQTPPPPEPAAAPPAAPSDSYKLLLSSLMQQWRGGRSAPSDAVGLGKILFAADSQLKTVDASTNLPPVQTLDKILRASFKRYDLDDSDHLNTSEELLLLCTNLSFKMRLKLSESELEAICSSTVADGAPVEAWPFPTFSTWFKAVFLHGILTQQDPDALAGPSQEEIAAAEAAAAAAKAAEDAAAAAQAAEASSSADYQIQIDQVKQQQAAAAMAAKTRNDADNAASAAAAAEWQKKLNQVHGAFMCC